MSEYLQKVIAEIPAKTIKSEPVFAEQVYFPESLSKLGTTIIISRPQDFINMVLVNVGNDEILNLNGEFVVSAQTRKRDLSVLHPDHRTLDRLFPLGHFQDDVKSVDWQLGENFDYVFGNREATFVQGWGIEWGHLRWTIVIPSVTSLDSSSRLIVPKARLLIYDDLSLKSTNDPKLDLSARQVNSY